MLDRVDKVILDHLFAYSRFTTKQLARVSGISQQAVSYRLKNLEGRDYISKYDAILNWNILPFIKKIYYIRSEFVDETISELKGSKALFGLSKIIGTYNLLAWCFFKTREEEKEFERKLKRCSWDVLEASEARFPQFSIFNTPLKLKVPQGKNFVPKLDEVDVNIMKYLSEYSRASVSEIGEAIKEDYDVVYYRIKRLAKSNYFFRFAAQVGFNSLDLRLFAISVKLHDNSNEKKIVEKLSKLDFFTAFVLGEDRLHLHIFSEDIDQYWERVKKISEIVGEDLEILENIYFEENLILNRYPFEYLLDSRVRAKMKKIKNAKSL